MNKRVAIIILNWNGRELLKRFLPSVVSHSPEWAEVIVADNGSTDDSIDLLRTEFPSVRLILLDRNYGFAEGYNRTIAQIDHEYCVLLNSDIEVTPGWMEAPVRLLDSDPALAGAQPKIRSWRDKRYFEYAGAAGGYMDLYGYPFCRGRVFHVVEEDEGQYDTPADILWATGACLFIRTTVYKEAGGLDAGFFAHQEEIDLCWRLRSRGYRLVCVPQSVVYHVGGATLDAENPRKTFLNFRNNLLMLYKNFGGGFEACHARPLLAGLPCRHPVPPDRPPQERLGRLQGTRGLSHAQTYIHPATGAKHAGSHRKPDSGTYAPQSSRRVLSEREENVSSLARPSVNPSSW